MFRPVPWRPFADLPEDTTGLTTGELDALLQVWNDRRGELAESGALNIFHTQLSRQWAIETGIIEGVYSIDRGTTQLLIERGIDASLIPRAPGQKSPELIALILQDHVEALEGLFSFVKGDRALSVGYIKELHAALLRHQETNTVIDMFGRVFEKPLAKGVYKLSPNNPTRPDGVVHEYCPPEHVASEMDRMISLHEAHERRDVPVEVEAAWLHHVFTQIHPFEDGNGRVARAIASLLFLKAGWFPLLITRDERAEYIEALEIADDGTLQVLSKLFLENQKKAFYRSFEIALEVNPPKTPEEAIAAARLVLEGRQRHHMPEHGGAKTTADTVFFIGSKRFSEMWAALNANVGSISEDFDVMIWPDHTGGSAPINQIAAAAKGLGYEPNFDDYHKSIGVSIRTSNRAHILLSIHSMGKSFNGFIAATVTLWQENAECKLASDGFFQINYREDPALTEARFQPWLEQALTKALNLWRSSLTPAT